MLLSSEFCRAQERMSGNVSADSSLENVQRIATLRQRRMWALEALAAEKREQAAGPPRATHQGAASRK